MIQINVCDTRWRTAFVAPGFPRLLRVYVHARTRRTPRAHIRGAICPIGRALARVSRSRICGANVCTGDAAHPPCDMRKLIVHCTSRHRRTRKPESWTAPGSISYPHERAGRLVPRSRSFISDVREPRPLVSRLRSSRDAHRFSRRVNRASLRSAKAKSFLVYYRVLGRGDRPSWIWRTKSKLLIHSFAGNIFFEKYSLNNPQKCSKIFLKQF